MHVLVGCNIENKNNGAFRCTQDGIVFWQKGSDAAGGQARWICSEMVIIPVLRLLLLLFRSCVGAF